MLMSSDLVEMFFCFAFCVACFASCSEIEICVFCSFIYFAYDCWCAS